MRTSRPAAAALLALVVLAGCQRRGADTPAPADTAATAMRAPERDTTIAPLHRLEWQALAAEGRLGAGTLVPQPERGFVALRLENDSGRPRTFRLVTLEPPGIREGFWTLSGPVRYTAVEGKGYVEMLHRFPDGEVHFARTIARSGPQRALSGTEPWRGFALTFRAHKPHRPSQIVVSVMLPARGMVELGPLALHEGWAAELAARAPR